MPAQPYAVLSGYGQAALTFARALDVCWAAMKAGAFWSGIQVSTVGGLTGYFKMLRCADHLYAILTLSSILLMSSTGKCSGPAGAAPAPPAQPRSRRARAQTPPSSACAKTPLSRIVNCVKHAVEHEVEKVQWPGGHAAPKLPARSHPRKLIPASVHGH